MIAMATSLSCRVSATSAFCWPTTQTPSIINCLVAIIHTKPVTAILVPKLVGMAMTLRRSISAMSSSDSFTLKIHPLQSTSVSLAIIQPNYSPSKTKNRLPWQSPLSPADPHLPHNSMGLSEPKNQTAS